MLFWSRERRHLAESRRIMMNQMRMDLAVMITILKALPGE
jgi:hypothetical protein